MVGIVAAVVLASAVYLLGLAHADPRWARSGLASGTTQLLPGSPSADPNDGFTAQALGHRAALDWLGGTLPWWNPYEGLGAPLAAELQSGALFPPAALLAAPWGQLPFHLLLQIGSGLAAYALLRRLRLGRAAALLGGMAFGLNGVLGFFDHAPGNPVPFLPLAVLAVQRLADRHAERRPGGAGLLALALAGSVYAGFPETAYLDALVVVVWAGWCVAVAEPGRRLRLAGRLSGAAAAGVALSAPVLVPFLEYLSRADVGAHTGAFSDIALGGAQGPPTLLPFVYGPIQAFQGPRLTVTAWAGGGWLTTSVVVLALVGLVGRRRRGLRVALAVLSLALIGRTFGVPGVWPLVDAVPGLRYIAVYRYGSAAWVFVAAVLAAFALDDLVTRAVSRRWLVGAAGGTLLLVGLLGLEAGHVTSGVAPADHAGAYTAGALIWGLVAAGAVGLVLLALPVRAGAAAAVAIVTVDAAAMVLFPQLSAPRGGRLDLGPVAYLARHLGVGRVFTLGNVLQPDYGSYFGIAQLDVNDLPVPAAFARFVTHRLDPGANPIVFVGADAGRRAGAPGPVTEFLTHLPGYQAAAVGYVLVGAGIGLPARVGTASLHLVYRDPQADIYRLTPTDPYLSAAGCTVTATARTAAAVDCARPSVLLRRELWMPGWSASVDGRVEPVRAAGVFQDVAVPAGRSRVAFTYGPPGQQWALGAFVAGLAALAGGGIARRRVARTASYRRLPLAAVGEPPGDVDRDVDL